MIPTILYDEKAPVEGAFSMHRRIKIRLDKSIDQPHFGVQVVRSTLAGDGGRPVFAIQ